MLQHDMDKPVNYWIFGSALFAIFFMLQYAVFGDYRTAAVYSLLMAGIVVVFHRFLNRAMAEHNKL